MIIAHLTTYCTPTWGDRLWALANGQASLAHQVYILTSNFTGPKGDFHRFEKTPGWKAHQGVRIAYLPVLFESRQHLLLRGAKGVLEEIKPDIVHFHNIESLGALGGLLYRKYAHRTFADLDAERLPERNWIHNKILLKIFGRYVDQFIVWQEKPLSPFCQELLEEGKLFFSKELSITSRDSDNSGMNTFVVEKIMEMYNQDV